MNKEDQILSIVLDMQGRMANQEVRIAAIHSAYERMHDRVSVLEARLKE